MHAWVSNAQAMHVVVSLVKRETMPVNASEVNEFTNLIASPLISIRRMHFLHDKITKLDIERDFVKEFEAYRFIAEANAKRNRQVYLARSVYPSDSFIWMTITWSFYISTGLSAAIFLKYCFITPTPESDYMTYIKDIWSIFTPIITLALGYAFGKGQ
ncbi:hypothetical protein L1D14_21590 [Vibrio tubiashii]|uniref:hypothetical protein n=1 Tax=Vibrio tubiashii TaxID=29498 RepID=UPI001EFDF571|nr:hypothetical protein [Vibrio tubiashii]MCG9578807.1 hypothetical protein [Vibrio tubiashii]